ncbi:nuclear pore complex protein NUP133 [Neltuma alba]|uniref:nuclear pore complex protein NUP133 n=1 Tax=Neltuma alba TaxID=207710 RepID=UPI0010A382EA|nr:nuclear pore complex protein NUP133-like [Prosopis alba]
MNDKILEKKAPIEVNNPKARVEDETFLFSMRLRVGGRPSGSAVIISGDGTATVSHNYRNSTRLYQFDLPYDAGKVLDASVLPCADDYEEGAWVVLTEKAGIWAIPEKAVILGGVEPPERSNVAPRRASSEAWDNGERQRSGLSGITRRTVQDEESEALLSHLFNEFLSSGEVDRSFEKLESSGSFERDGETNVFVRMRQALQTVLEHGEKLAAMIQLRELQNLISQNRSTSVGSTNSSLQIQMSGALWDVIQIVGERARRNTVLLMDRDNAEVFYSKVSELEDFFYCLDGELECVISPEQPSGILIQRLCELSNACVTIIKTCFNYKNENRLWYPPPEGLAPWYCQPVVRKGVWSVASVLLQLLNEISGLDMYAKLDLYNHLQALAEVLLEAYAGAVTAKIERSEEHKSLLNEYWERRDMLLVSLYQQVKDYEASHKVSIEGNKNQSEEAVLKITSHLLSIAKRHGCYKIMWQICCDMNNSELLRNIMQESLGPNGGFSYYVFKQLHESRQFCELLRLGEEFPDELTIFLKEHPDLLWLHELFLHQFSLASETLHELALTQSKKCTSVAEEKELEYVNSKLKLAERKHLLYLSKIAAVAAGEDTDSQAKVDRIEADLKILKLQEEIMKLLTPIEDKQLDEQQLLHPEDLIKLCLEGEGQELSLWAFDVFAWTSSSFRKTHRKLLEECWKKAASQDDWSKFFESSIVEGWSDERNPAEFEQHSTFPGFKTVLRTRSSNIRRGL